MSGADAPAAVHTLAVEAIDDVAAGTYWLALPEPDGVECDPGHFFMISPVDAPAAIFLGRPFSIGDVRQGRWRFLLRALGRGTAWMRRMAPGTPLRVVGPLGRPFRLSDAAVHRMVAGGIGLAPFFHLARRLRSERPDARIELLYGERTDAAHLALDADERGLFDSVERFTEDGTRGLRGTVIDGIGERFGDAGVSWYGCGPHPMLRALAARLAAAEAADAQFSLEERMACGFGVCQGCVVPNREAPPRYRLLCLDGPVVDPREIAW
ncbi:MAG: hypothetical protein R3199_09745 [Gemmatimonadota bacterium]|nr:hypothetical protein [Gemmatimonadota bacterium]